MSFVSQLLERLGVLKSASAVDLPVDEDTEEVVTEPPGPAPDLTALVPTALPETPFDPEQTISSLDHAAYLDMDPFEPERTLVGAPQEVTVAGDPPQNSATRTTRSVLLADLLAGRGIQPSPQVAQLGLDVDIALEQSFAETYEQAGLLPPKHQWTVERVHTAIQQSRAKGLTPVQVRFLMEEALVNDGSSLLDIAADAAAKDEVLDALESELVLRVEKRDNRLDQRAESVQRQILALQAERDDLKAQAAAARNRFAKWQERKSDAERQWADVLDVLAPFV